MTAPTPPSCPRRAPKPRTLFEPSLKALKPQQLSSKIVEGNDEAHLAESVSEPKNRREALKPKLWRNAMNTEWNANLEKGTVRAIAPLRISDRLAVDGYISGRLTSLEPKRELLTLGSCKTRKI